jgi:hypothetical protein
LTKHSAWDAAEHIKSLTDIVAFEANYNTEDGVKDGVCDGVWDCDEDG